MGLCLNRRSLSISRTCAQVMTSLRERSTDGLGFHLQKKNEGATSVQYGKEGAVDLLVRLHSKPQLW